MAHFFLCMRLMHIKIFTCASSAWTAWIRIRMPIPSWGTICIQNAGIARIGLTPPPTKFWTQMRWVQSQRCQFSKCPFRTPTNLQYIIWIENGHPRKISKKSCNLVRDHVPWPLIAFMCPGFLWNACLCVKTQLTIKGENEIESNYDFWN